MSATKNTTTKLTYVKNHILRQWRIMLQGLTAIVILLGFYVLSMFVGSGWITWTISSVALVIIFITCLIRANDLGHEKIAPRWHARRLGFVLTGAAATALIIGPLTYLIDFPTWKEVLFRAGLALVWLTSPDLPPWPQYMRGAFSRKDLEEVNRNLMKDNIALAAKISETSTKVSP